MNKVICDICGTSYSDSAETCPICGYSRIFGDDEVDERFIQNGESATDERYYKPVKTGKGIFDYDAQEGSDDPEDLYSDQVSFDPEPPQEPTPNYFVVIVLVVLITLLVVASGFLFFRYFVPNLFDSSSAPTLATEPLSESEASVVPTDAQEIDATAVPCERIALTGGLQTLSKEGQMWLLHVKVTPEDTTDTISYTSEDESIATVSDNGRITAVSEGKTVITIRCGTQSMTCPVIVDYSVKTNQEETDESIPLMTLSGNEEETAPQAAQEDDEEGDVPQATEETAPETEPTETTQSTEPKTVTLKLKKVDISFGRPGVSSTLELDCDLDPAEVSWFTNNPNVALVRDGVVTALGSGTTKVFAKYGDQQVECIVRCNF